MTSKCIISRGNTFIKRRFVSATNYPSLKLEKKTNEKIKEAAETVKDGTKDIVHEVKRVGHAITDKLDATGDVCGNTTSSDNEDGIDVIAQKAEDVMDSIKNVAHDVKENITNK